nr:hypothetical protein [Streptomyces alanosinicus]
MDAVRSDIPAVNDVLQGLKALVRQLLVDVAEGVDVLLWCRAGDDLDDDVRAGLVAGLGLVIAIADPVTLVGRGDLLAVAGPQDRAE